MTNGRRRTQLNASVVVAVAALAGCRAPSPTDFERAMALQECADQLRCGLIGAAGIPECESVRLQALNARRVVYSIDDAIAAGRLSYDPASARACIEESPRRACPPAPLWTTDYYRAPARPLAASCLAALQGLVPAGEACQDSRECANGWCETKTRGCAGICRPWRNEGDRCTVDDECAPPRRCNQCTCVTPRGVGASCAGKEECGDDEYCDSAKGGVCNSRLPDGATCASEFACRNGSACIGLTFTEMKNITTVLKPGQCNPISDDGGKCDATADVTGCPYYAVCSTDSNNCIPLGVLGSSCGPLSAAIGDDNCWYYIFKCRPNMQCDSDSKRCVPGSSQAPLCQ